MSTITAKKPLNEMLENWQTMLDCADAPLRIVSKLGADILKSQSESGAAWIAQASQGATAPLTMKDVADSLWQAPIRYQMQSRRMVDSLMETASMVSRGQQELMQWAGKVCGQNIEQTSKAMSIKRTAGALSDANIAVDCGHRLLRSGVGRRTHPGDVSPLR